MRDSQIEIPKGSHAAAAISAFQEPAEGTSRMSESLHKLHSAMKPRANKGIRPPELPRRLRAETLKALADQAEYTERLLAQCNLSGQTARDVLFEQVTFRRTTLSRSALTRPRLFDVRAEITDLSGADWKKARLRRVEFIDCRLLGVQWLEAQLEDGLFRGCNLENAVFAGSTFEAACFEDCVLRGALFDGADLSGVVFRRCDLSHVDLREAKLCEADFRGSQIDGIQLSPRELRGAIIDPIQAVQVAGLFGITVKPIDD